MCQSKRWELSTYCSNDVNVWRGLETVIMLQYEIIMKLLIDLPASPARNIPASEPATEVSF